MIHSCIITLKIVTSAALQCTKFVKHFKKLPRSTPEHTCNEQSISNSLLKRCRVRGSLLGMSTHSNELLASLLPRTCLVRDSNLSDYRTQPTPKPRHELQLRNPRSEYPACRHGRVLALLSVFREYHDSH